MATEKTEADQEKLHKKDILAYGAGGFASTLPNQFRTQFGMNFMTDMAGLPIGLVGTCSMLMSIWDAVNDPLIGKIVDNTNTRRWGKYRPHMIFGAIGLAVTILLQFFVPPLSSRGLIIYYCAVMMLLSVFFTQFTVPWQALNSVLSHDAHERNLLLTSRQLSGAVATSAVGLFTIPVITHFKNASAGWFCSAAIVAVLCVITAFLAANAAKMKDYYMSIATPPMLSWRRQSSVVFKNPAVLCNSLMLGMVNLGISINATISLYYIKYVVGSLSVLAVISAIQICVNLILVPFLPSLMRRFGKIAMLRISMLLQFISAVILLVLRENAVLWQVVIMSLFTTTGLTFSNICCFAMIPDCTDYTELHFGCAQAGFINASSTFVRKFCGSFSTLIVGSLLAFTGYAANIPVSAKSVHMILAIKTAIPILTLLAVLVLSCFYPITAGYAVKMRKVLKKKHSLENKRSIEQEANH